MIHADQLNEERMMLVLLVTRQITTTRKIFVSNDGYDEYGGMVMIIMRRQYRHLPIILIDGENIRFSMDLSRTNPWLDRRVMQLERDDLRVTELYLNEERDPN